MAGGREVHRPARSHQTNAINMASFPGLYRMLWRGGAKLLPEVKRLGRGNYRRPNFGEDNKKARRGGGPRLKVGKILSFCKQPIGLPSGIGDGEPQLGGLCLQRRAQLLRHRDARQRLAANRGPSD